jgi:hypothetical protein
MAPDHTSEHTCDLTIDLDTLSVPSTTRPSTWPTVLRSTPHRIMATGLTAMAALLASHSVVGGRLPPNPPPASAVPAAGQPEPFARLIAPATARAGDRIPILAFRNPTLCGPAELRLDGAKPEQQTTAYARSDSPTNPRVFMAIDVPRTTKPGTHQIDLIGPVSTTRGAICADSPERQGHIATTTIAISATTTS